MLNHRLYMPILLIFKSIQFFAMIFLDSYVLIAQVKVLLDYAWVIENDEMMSYNIEIWEP